MYTPALLNLLLSSTLISAAALKPRELSPDDVILYNAAGRIEVMKKVDYLAATNLTYLPSDDTPFESNTTEALENISDDTDIEKRCDSRTTIVQNKPATFLNWDVPMSSVVSGKNGAASVSVSNGYQISNTLGVSASADFGTVSGVLGASFGINWSQTWGSTYTAQYTFTIPAGKIGAVVSNPETTRYSGKVLKGCVGAQRVSSTYQGDAYRSKAYGGLSWVEGIIGVCLGDNYPLQKCVGSGNL